MKSKSPKARPARVHRSPDRPSTGDWLTGVHSVKEALRAGRRRIDRLLLREEGGRGPHADLVALARSLGVPIEGADERTFERICGPELRSQGVALAVGPLPELSLVELVRAAGPSANDAADAEAGHGKGRGRRLVVLDGVEDPQNVGAIARVAESAGCAGLVLTDRRAPGLTAAVSRASAGAIEWLPVARVTNLVRALEELKSERFWILAAAVEESESLFELPDRILTGDLVVVLGAEGKGIRPGVLEQADHRISIPMRGEIESLNVATAGAVILYELLRRAEKDGRLPAGDQLT
ncbi:MAG: 23S rRNA (guanosine(2251)-2'-O)-methyltransferase RlmB [Isosphaeraceae bacterium]|nr:23S rRNA (guanosine(2251)-2'-O)-methyltransferase RlmB [Isosphaeraceae bacterium]